MFYTGQIKELFTPVEFSEIGTTRRELEEQVYIFFGDFMDAMDAMDAMDGCYGCYGCY